MTDQPSRAEIAALADELAARCGGRVAGHERAGTFPFDDWQDLHSSGYLRLVIPRRYGGAGASVLDMVVAQERLARGNASTALGTAMLISVLGRAIETGAWPEPVLEAVCRELATEGGGINNCVTETELGSISRGGTPATAAEPADGGWLITGHKIFVTGAPALRFLVTGLVLPPGPGAPHGFMASAIVRNPSPGLRIEPTWSNSLAVRTAGNDDVFYDRVFVPDGWVVERRPIGVPATGKAAGPGANPWALPLAAVYLGTGQAALDCACDYARSRVPPALGKPIAEQPHIQSWLGSMQIALDAARTVLHDTARAWMQEPGRRGELAARIATAKYLCTNAACTATETALRVGGGFSLTDALPLGRYFRDARAGLFAPPQDDLALAIAGRAALAARARETESLPRGRRMTHATLVGPLPVPLIDHVIVNARDGLDATAELWTRLGFQLTPRGHHTLGSSNNLAILGNDYIELLGVLPGHGARTDVLDWPAGLNGLVYKTLDSDGVHTALKGSGAPVLAPQEFSRPVDLGDGRSGDAAFRTVRLEQAAVPAGRMFFCHHLTPELVWHEPWRRHPNGAMGLAGMVIAAEEPGVFADLFAGLFGADAVRHRDGAVLLPAGLATVEVVTPAVLRERFGDAAPEMDGRPQIMAALLVRTAGLDRARAALGRGGVAAVAGAGHGGATLCGPTLTVGAAGAGGLVLVFGE